MSTVQFKCVSCGFEKAIPAQYGGKRVRCPKCQADNLVPPAPAESTVLIPPAGQSPAPAAARPAAAPAPAPAAAPNVIKFHCPLCNQKIGVAAQHAGRQVRCPKCKAVVAVPAAPKPAASAQPVAPIPVAPAPAPVPDDLQLEDFNLKPLDDLSTAGISLERGPAVPSYSQDEFRATSSDRSRPAKPAKVSTTDASTLRRRYVAFGIIGGVYLAVLCLLGGAAYTYFMSKPKAQVIDVEPFKANAQKFMDLLAKEDVLAAKNMTVPEIRSAVSKEEFKKIGTAIKDAGGFVFDSEEHSVGVETHKLGVVLHYRPAAKGDSSASGGQAAPSEGETATDPNAESSTDPNTGSEQSAEQPADQAKDTGENAQPQEKPSADDEGDDTGDETGSTGGRRHLSGPSLSLTMLEYEPGKYTIESLMYHTSNWRDSVSASSEMGDQIDLQSGMSEVIGWMYWAGKLALWVLPAILLVIAVEVACCWVIFNKAGEPGWAAIVPFYSGWVFAEAAGKPGWWGLVLAIGALFSFCGCVGYFTVAADAILFLTLCIGLANTFEKGALYGIGLWLLGPIFFPLLAFWDE